MTIKKNCLIGLAAFTLTLTAFGSVAHARGAAGGQGGGTGGSSGGMATFMRYKASPAAAGGIRKVIYRRPRYYRSLPDGCTINPNQHRFDRGGYGKEDCQK